MHGLWFSTKQGLNLSSASTSPTFGKSLTNFSEPHSLICNRLSTLENCMRTKCNNLFKEHSTVPRWNIKFPPTIPMGQIKLKIRSYSWLKRFLHLHFRDWNKTTDPGANPTSLFSNNYLIREAYVIVLKSVSFLLQIGNRKQWQILS